MAGVDPLAYLHDVLDWLQDHPVNRIIELTPKRWALAWYGGRRWETSMGLGKTAVCVGRVDTVQQ